MWRGWEVLDNLFISGKRMATEKYIQFRQNYFSLLFKYELWLFWMRKCKVLLFFHYNCHVYNCNLSRYNLYRWRSQEKTCTYSYISSSLSCAYVLEPVITVLVCIWRSDDNLERPILSCYHRSSRTQLSLSVLVTSIFTHWTVSLPPWAVSDQVF